ncbi:ABC transporter permease [Caproiciproducens sp. NJN-50]|nr:MULTISPECIES: ABC transporter permease [Acutalibacteraceae]QAT51216.1 ABC transporter permease [Caproiciproducens sp. NJN-50]
MAYLSSLDPMNFLTAVPGNVAQGIIWGIMALGVFITFRLLNFADLTVDGTFATGGAVAVVLILADLPVPLALAAAVAAGFAAGLVTGLLNTVLGIPDILAGILTQISLWSVNLVVLSGANKAVNVDKYPLIVTLRNVESSIVTALVFAAVLICVLYWYFGTEQGSAIRATGSNPQMAKAQGINIDFMKVLAISLSNGLVGLSGGLLAQYQGFADIKMGQGSIVIGLAAVIIGEVLGDALLGKHMNFAYRLIFVVFGGVVYYLVIGLVMWLKMPTDLLKLLTAVIVAIFLAVPYLRAKSKNSFALAGRRGARKNA